MNSLFTGVIAYFFLWPLLLFARNEPGGQTVEVKCLIPAEKIAEFEGKVNLGSKIPLTRVVSFFDTKSLTLFQHEPKVILRARYDSAHETDTTVKIRNGKARGSNVECEFDKVLGKERTMSCSVTDKKQEKAQIKRANVGRNVKRIFSKEQERMVKNAFGKLDWQTLTPYGPVKGIQVWKKIRLPEGPNLTVERWKLPARSGKPMRVLVEVSAKVSVAEEVKTSRWIAGLVGLPEIGGDQQSETKTKIVLEHFKSTSAR